MERFKTIHRFTGEVRTGNWEELADLDIRLWTRPKLIEAEPEVEDTIILEAFCWMPDRGKVLTLTKIPIRNLLTFMSRAEALKRIQERNWKHFSKAV